MQREIDERLIRPEKLMGARDMAKVGCDGCRGCSFCCETLACTIVLDPWDIRELKRGLNLSFEGLLSEGLITLSVVDGVVLPGLAVRKDSDACVFLGEDKRCTIHGFRPGICRMFPLARIWNDDGSFAYFLQEGECPKATGVKVRIDRWLGVPKLREYEAFLASWHAELSELRRLSADPGLPEEERSRLQTEFLARHFLADS